MNPRLICLAKHGSAAPTVCLIGLVVFVLTAACSDSGDATSDGVTDAGDAGVSSDGAHDASAIDDASGGDAAILVDGGADGATAADGGAGDGGPTFALLVTESPPGPDNGVMTSWGGVQQYTVAGDGATLVAGTGIAAGLLADPAGLAFRASSSEVFVGNRHGNNAADGTAGSISRFKYDPLARTFTPTGTITGNGLSGVHSMSFSPTSGELFAANFGGGVSRFTFDGTGVAVANGVLGDGSCRGVLVAPDGKRLYVTSATDSIRQFDLTTGSEVTPAISVPSSPQLHYFGLRGNHVYVAGLINGLIHVLTLDATDALTVKGTFAASSPVSLAISADGLEMFTAGHKTSDVIERFAYDPTADSWSSTAMVSAQRSLGAVLIVP